MQRISIQHVSKHFQIGFKKNRSVLARITDAVAGKEQKRKILVLDAISLDINAGEIVGIIGNNGSGKSTLLRLIAGIYLPDAGGIQTNGTIVSIINLGTALKERLTMRENIFLVGSLFGMSRHSMLEHFDSMVEFSELTDFTETKIYQFSAGMLQRLAFSIAIHAKPDILLLDEVFEVGDESFRKKSAEKIRALAGAGTAIVFVTHDLDMVRKQCDRVVWLANGKVHADGTPDEVTKNYVE